MRLQVAMWLKERRSLQGRPLHDMLRNLTQHSREGAGPTAPIPAEASFAAAQGV